jgi:hypothetical protein
MEAQLINIVRRQAALSGQETAALLAFIEVETGGRGFDTTTGKIIIQFEPAWFKKKAPYAPSGVWSLNGVERQEGEWKAFNDAFAKNAGAAMESTSIGLGQVMGFHWQRLGYSSVGAMWDDAKTGIERQVWQIARFIATDARLQACLKAKDWDGVATIYNGSGYKALALKYGREPYNLSMAKAYEKYRKL